MECPECGTRLGKENACRCGWRSKPDAEVTRECTRCEKQRRVEVAGMPGTYPCQHCGAISSHFCHQCGQRSGSTTAYSDGRRLCPTCRLNAVKAIASQASDLCAECGVPVAVHIAEFRELGKKITERVMHL